MQDIIPLHIHWLSHAGLHYCDILAVEAFNLVELLRHNRAPAEVMLALAAEDAHLQKKCSPKQDGMSHVLVVLVAHTSTVREDKFVALRSVGHYS